MMKRNATQKKLTYKTGDYVMLSRDLYCEILSYANGVAMFRVINGAWEGKLTDSGKMTIGYKDTPENVVEGVFVEYVFLPGEDQGSYNDVINKYNSYEWYHTVVKYIYYYGRTLKQSFRKFRINLSKAIDPRTKHQRWVDKLDDDIPF